MGVMGGTAREQVYPPLLYLLFLYHQVPLIRVPGYQVVLHFVLYQGSIVVAHCPVRLATPTGKITPLSLEREKALT